MECPIITWKDGDEKREFGNAKIKHYTTYEPTILPYINESLDINKPILYRSIIDDSSAKSLYDSKNILLTLLVNNEENILGIKYFSDIKINKTPRDDNVDLNITFNKNIIDNGLNLILNCYYDIYSNTVKFEIKKKDETTTITFLSPYKLIPPSRIKGNSSIQSGQLIFRPYADKEKYFNRPPAIISHKRTVIKKINNYLKDLKELLNETSDKNLVKITTSYEIINILVQKLSIPFHDINYNRYSNLHQHFFTKQNFESYIKELQNFYNEYTKLNNTTDLIPIEEITSFKKEVDIGSDYIHENDVENIKRLSILDSRFKLIEITEVQQIMVDDNDDKYSIPFIKKIKRNGYKKKIINKEVKKFIPVNYRYFTPFTFYDIITDKFKKIYYYEAFGINKDNYRIFYKIIEEFKLQCLNLISLYNHLLLVPARYVNLNDTNRRTYNNLGISKNTTSKQLITKIKLNKKEICFFNEFINNTTNFFNFEISKYRLIVNENISKESIDPSLEKIEMQELINIELLEGNTEKTLENYIKENNIIEANKLFGDIIGKIIENNKDDSEKEPIEEYVFDSLLIPAELTEIKSDFDTRFDGKKTYAEITTELASSDTTHLFKPKIISSTEKKHVRSTIVEEVEEDSDYESSSMHHGRISATGSAYIDSINDPSRRKKHIKDIIDEPLRYYRKEQGDKIRKKMQNIKHKKGSNKSNESYNFFIDDKIKQLKKSGIKEDDYSHNFIANFEYDLLMGKNDFKVILIFYLIKIQEIYNRSFDEHDNIIKDSDFNKLLDDTERNICTLFLDGEKTRIDNLRANGIEIALNNIKKYDSSFIVKQSILKYLNNCKNLEFINYMKKIYKISDDEVLCRGGESIIRHSSIIIDIISDKRKIEDITIDDLRYLGINPSKTSIIDTPAYKAKIEKILTKFSGKHHISNLPKRINKDFINSIFLKLSVIPSLSIYDVINSKPEAEAEIDSGSGSDNINLGDINIRTFNESMLSKIYIITNSGTGKEKSISNNIFDTLEFIKRKTKLSDVNKTDLKNIIFDKLNKGKNYKEALDDALIQIVKLNEYDIISRLMSIYKDKITRKQAKIIASKIISGGLDEKNDYIKSDSTAYTEWLGEKKSKKEKYIKYKMKYLSLINKLKEKGILI